jgi:hypothetical protein
MPTIMAIVVGVRNGVFRFSFWSETEAFQTLGRVPSRTHNNEHAAHKRLKSESSLLPSDSQV